MRIIISAVIIAMLLTACTKDASAQDSPTSDRIDFEIVDVVPGGGEVAAVFTFKRPFCSPEQLPVVNLTAIWANGATINSYMTWVRGGLTDCLGYIRTPPQGGQWSPILICKVMPSTLDMGGNWPVVRYGGRSCWERQGTTIRLPHVPLLYRPAQVQTGDQK